MPNITIEQYMDSCCYGWKKYAEFERFGSRYVVVSEWGPAGIEEAPYILCEKYGKIYNMNGDCVSREEA